MIQKIDLKSRKELIEAQFKNFYNKFYLCFRNIILILFKLATQTNKKNNVIIILLYILPIQHRQLIK